MVGYHLYVLDKLGHIAGRSDFVWQDDAAAIRFAETYPCPHGVELWAGVRRIGKFESNDVADFPAAPALH
ncbi:MAG TPA: hypothetical protein VKQ27_19700 [Acetobacteraceae bacterium]|nr:hypothetical protein [Acetobacteraceae bacterium]